MKYKKFMKEKENLAIENNKEESAIYLLLLHVTGLKSNELFLKLEDEIDDNIINKFNELFDLYLYHEKPIQYLIGYRCFYGYDFIVNENVLIPRNETEELVENVLSLYNKYFKNKKVNACDVATGSGCIGITLNLEEPNINVCATDISDKALDVAKENNKKLGANVKFYQGDMLEPLKGMKFDILVSNPPYIPEDEEVSKLVKDNEPNVALFGGKDGLKFYKIILAGAKDILNDKAIIAFEHGYNKTKEIEDIARYYFPNAKIISKKDLEGLDRMTFVIIGDFYE